MDPQSPGPQHPPPAQEDASALPHDPTPGERIGPYEVLRPVARGGMATVLAVRDTRNGSECALKLLLPVAQADEARTRFRREFRALSRLQHPNVLEVYEWGLRGDRPWFTMELVDGLDLREAVEHWHAELPAAERLERAESVLVQMARALAYIHERGIIHRDVTPGNIMLDARGRARLMDFGVVKELGADVTAVGEVIGTVSYISPEQVQGEQIDARADLYSLGAVLYFMLTGRRPFQARTLQGYLDKHLHQPPRPVRELDPLVPPHLDEICLRLLAKSPDQRYASAAHLLHVLGDTSDVDSDPSHFPPRLVGRTAIKARIRESMEALRSRGQGAAVVLCGPYGQGKSRLLEQAERWAVRLGLRTARSRCRPNDRPFGAWSSIYRELAPDDPPAVLRATFEGEDDGAARERYPVISAFKELVTEAAPCVIVLDDLDMADPATMELLEYLVHNTLELEQHPVVYVVGQRSGPTCAHLSKQLDGPLVHHLILEPLAESEVEELVLSLLPPSPQASSLALRLFSEADGNPAAITEMLRGLVDQGIMVREGERYRLAFPSDDLSRSHLPMSASLRQSLAARVEPLEGDALLLGRVLATARRSVELDVLVAAAPFDEDRVMEALDQLIEASVAMESRVGDVEKVDLKKRRMSDILLEEVPETGRRLLHRQLGEVLERHHRYQPQAVVEELAYHFEGAGLAPKAYAYLIQTARRHQNSSLFEEALGFLDRALALEPTARELMVLDAADRELAEIHLARSLALNALGRSEAALEAARQAERMARIVRDPGLESRVSGELGTQLRNQGRLDEAEHHLRVALEKAEEVGDRRLLPQPLYQLGAIHWARGNLTQAERHWQQSLSTAQRIGDERAQGYGYNGLGILAICKGSSLEARRHLERSAALFEHLGMLAPLSLARVNLAELYLSTGILRKALELAERTIAMAQEVQHPHGISMGLALRAQVLIELGRFDEAQRNAVEALRLARELGITDDQVSALAALAQVELVRERPEDALRYLAELRPLIMAGHDTEGLAPQVVAWHAQALAAQGRTREGIQVLHGTTTEQRHWPHTKVQADLARGRALRLLGYPQAGQQLLTRALSTAEANGFRFYQLLAHQELLQVITDPVARGRHQRIATALARSLAANLPADDAQRFIERGWGHYPGEETPS